MYTDRDFNKPKYIFRKGEQELEVEVEGERLEKRQKLKPTNVSYF
jgi:hypothetical protein